MNDRFEYPAGQKATRVAPGVYTVTKDIENPNYDLRSNDFIRLPTIKAGTKVLVTDNRCRDYSGESKETGPVVIIDGCRVTKLGGRSYDAFQTGHYAYEALVAALELIDSPDTMDYLANLKHQHGYAADPEDIVARLLINGIVTREQVEAAVAANDIEG